MSPAQPPRALRVAVIGPALDAKGGIASVCRTWLGAPGLSDLELRYFPSVGEGSPLTKLRGALTDNARFLDALAGGYRPDLFHIHLSWHTSFYRKLAWFIEARRTGRPVIVHLHMPDIGAFFRTGRAHAAAMAWMFRRADRVVALTEAMAAELRALFGPGPRIEVLYNPVELEPLSAPPRPRTDHPTVLFLGEIGHRKGAFDLIAAAELVLAAAPGARFQLYGNGEVERARAEVAARGLSPAVEVPGWISGPARLEALRTAHLLVLPSYQEGLPMSILEAMGAGLPVVATPVGGVAEAVIDGETGALVQPGDVAGLAAALTRLVQDPALRLRQGAAGRRLAEERFDLDVITEQLRGLWAEVARTPRVEV